MSPLPPPKLSCFLAFDVKDMKTITSYNQTLARITVSVTFWSNEFCNFSFSSSWSFSIDLFTTRTKSIGLTREHEIPLILIILSQRTYIAALTRVKCVQYGDFTRDLRIQLYREQNVTRTLTRRPKLDANCVYSDEGWNLLLFILYTKYQL